MTAATKNLVSLRQRLVVFRNAVIFNFIGKYFIKQLKLRCNCRLHLYRITRISYCNQHQAGRRLSVQNHVLFRRLKNAAVFYSIFYSVFLTYVYGDIITFIYKRRVSCSSGSVWCLSHLPSKLKITSFPEGNTNPGSGNIEIHAAEQEFYY